MIFAVILNIIESRLWLFIASVVSAYAYDVYFVFFSLFIRWLSFFLATG